MHSINRRRALKTLFCSSAALALNLYPRRAQAEITKDALHFLAIGDFGTGAVNQTAVSKGMQEFVAKNAIKPEGLLLIGDNFYGPTKDGGLTVDSKRWQTGFEDMYPKSTFPGPCWAVLGNHDYHDNAGGEQVQLAYAQKLGGRWTMPAKWYRVDLGGPKPLVTLICLDTNFPTVSGGRDKKTGLPKNHMSAAEEQEQLAWFKAELAKPRAPFTIVMAHHPIYSNGDHGDTKPLAQWDDLLQQHQVHAYLCGHDHDMQHLELEGRFTSHILSGGGGARVRKLESERKMPYGKDVNGFTHLAVQPDGLTFTHHGVDGGVLHKFTKRLDGKVEIA
ncbi:MAG: metallophosphoesterase [Prosthecobacter sp.]|nr:metallophosphoesterase [Prosthecobacter sp.]